MQPGGPAASSKATKRVLFPGSLYMSWGVLYKTVLVGDPETFIFGFMQLFDLPGGQVGSSKSQKGVFFLVRQIKVGNLGGLA